MEEKMMSMLEQLYIEVKSMKNDISDLKQGQTNMQSDIKDLKQGQTNMQNNIKDLKQGQARAEERLTRIEAKVDTIDSKLDTVEAHNASRHVEIRDEIIDIKKNITAVEIVTAKNWNEIATLKAIK